MFLNFIPVLCVLFLSYVALKLTFQVTFLEKGEEEGIDQPASHNSLNIAQSKTDISWQVNQKHPIVQNKWKWLSQTKKKTIAEKEVSYCQMTDSLSKILIYKLTFM